MPVYEMLFEKTGLLKKLSHLADGLEFNSVAFKKIHLIENFMRMQLQRESCGCLTGVSGEAQIAANLLFDLLNINRFKDLENRCIDAESCEHTINGMSVSVLLPVLSYAIQNRHPILIDSRYFDECIGMESLIMLCMFHSAEYPVELDLNDFNDPECYQEAVQTLLKGGIVVVSNREKSVQAAEGYNAFIADFVLLYAMYEKKERLYQFIDCFTAMNFDAIRFQLEHQQELCSVLFLQNTSYFATKFQQMGCCQNRREFAELVAPYLWQKHSGIKGFVAQLKNNIPFF